ncbi:MAG: hypothetical protein GQ574_26685 [Crocinitomix sp.]|nr:hypothetical protein [Crocinitomix sp.]
MKCIYSILILFLFYSCNDDNYVPVVAHIIEKGTQNPVHNAIVTFNALEEFKSDTIGEIRTSYNLHHHLADSISFYVKKDGYISTNFSFIIGNTQKDVYVLEFEKE